ncbi:MAG: CatB-related O-acetyltransferase [Cetobacterium sp.]
MRSIKILCKSLLNKLSLLKLKLNNNKFEGKNVVAYSTKLKGCTLGFGSYIGKNSFFYNTKIGKFCSIGKNIEILGSTHPINWVSTHPAFYSLRLQSGFTFVKYQKFEEIIKKETIIENDVWIGNNVIIFAGIKIGSGSIIAAGSIVTKDIPDYEIWGGVPAKKIRDRYSDKNIKDILSEIKWWEKDMEWLKNNAEYFNNIEKFIRERGRNE